MKKILLASIFALGTGLGANSLKAEEIPATTPKTESKTAKLDSEDRCYWVVKTVGYSYKDNFGFWRFATKKVNTYVCAP